MKLALLVLYILSSLICLKAFLRGTDERVTTPKNGLIASLGIWEGMGKSFTSIRKLFMAPGPYFKDNELLRFHLSKQIYCVKDSKKIPVDDSDFLKFHWKLEEVRVISSAFEVNILEHMQVGPRGLLLSYDDCFSEGELVRFHLEKQVYKIENRQKRPIMSADVFYRNGWDFDDVHVLQTEHDVDALEAMKTGPPIN